MNYSINLFITYSLSCSVIFYVISKYLATRYERKSSKYKSYIYFCIAIFILVFVNLFFQPLLNLSCLLILTFVLKYILFVKNQKWDMWLDLGFVLAIAFVEEIGIIFINIFFHTGDILQHLNYENQRILNVVFSTTTIIILYKISFKFFQKKETAPLPRRYMLIYLIQAIFNIICIHNIMILIDKQPISQVTAGAFVIIILLINIFLDIQVAEYISLSTLSFYKLKSLEKQSEMQYSYYKRLENNYENSRRLLHDIKNHLHVLEKMYLHNNFSEAKVYQRDLYNFIDQLAIIIYTKNTVINILLNEIVHNNSEIDFDIYIEDLDLDFISGHDMTTIFGNLLDNAVTACNNLTRDKKRITIYVVKFNEFILINFKNYFSNTINSNVYSGQGLGLTNVERTVEKYGGNYSFYKEYPIYETNIYVPMK